MSPLPRQAPAARRQAACFSLRIRSSVPGLAVPRSQETGRLLPSARLTTVHVAAWALRQPSCPALTNSVKMGSAAPA